MVTVVSKKKKTILEFYSIFIIINTQSGNVLAEMIYLHIAFVIYTNPNPFRRQLAIFT